MNQTYDDYISVYVTDEHDVEYEVCFGLYHGRGGWSYWKDTGYEFDVQEDVTLIYQEAFDQRDGSSVCVPVSLVLKAEEIAAETYWERYADGQYN